MHALLRDLHFKEVAETTPDSKCRVTLKKISTKAHHYKMYINDSGQIVLDPQLSIPASEMWLFKNKKALAAVLQGIEDAKAGRLVKRHDDFTKYVK